MTARGERWSDTSAWARRVETLLRELLRSDIGGAAVLLAATVTALVWVNVHASSTRVALESRIEPRVVGLARGLLVWATPAARSDLEHAGKRFRQLRAARARAPACGPREHQDPDLAPTSTCSSCITRGRAT